MKEQLYSILKTMLIVMFLMFADDVYGEEYEIEPPSGYAYYGIITHSDVCVNFSVDPLPVCQVWTESFGQFVGVIQFAGSTAYVDLEEQNVILTANASNIVAESDFHKELKLRLEQLETGKVQVRFDKKYIRYDEAQEKGNALGYEYGVNESVDVLKTAHNISRKALITTNYINENVKEINAQALVKYYSRPDTKSEKYELGEVVLFDIFYVLAETANSQLLVRLERIGKYDNRFEVLGWVDKGHIRPWHTSVGAEFNKSNYVSRQKCGPGKLFLSKDDRTTYDVESARVTSLPFYVHRYPVLENDGNDVKLVHITGVSGQVKSVEALRKLESTITADAQIVILIDATLGMGPHIRAVKAGVQSFLNSMKGNRGKVLPEVAIASYRDYHDGEGIFTVHQTFTNSAQLLSEAVNYIAVGSHDDDHNRAWAIPEALFHGIDKVATGADGKLSWNDEQFSKYLLVIGDYGNHFEYKKYANTTHLGLLEDEKFTISDLSQKLSNKQIDIFGLQVNLGKGGKHAVYADKFEQQLRDLAANNISTKLTYSGEPKTFLMATGDSAADIYTSLKELTDTKGKEQKVIKNMVSGLKVYDTEYKAEILRQLGIEPDQIVQVTSIRYTQSKVKCDGKDYQQLSYRVLINKHDLKSLTTALHLLVRSIRSWNSKNYQNFEATLMQIVKNLTKDDFHKDMHIADYLRKRFGIPIKTNLLERNIGQAVNYMRGLKDHERLALLQVLDLSFNQLESVLQERELVIESWDETRARYKIKPNNQLKEYLFDMGLKLPDDCNTDDVKCQEINKIRRGGSGGNQALEESAWVPIEYFP